MRGILFLVPFALGLFSFAAFCIVVDSVYYGTITYSLDKSLWTEFEGDFKAQGNFVITPMNNLLYNLNVDNLAQHGIHSRFTHFAVNLPLLFGPLAVFALVYLPNAFLAAANDPSAHVFYGKIRERTHHRKHTYILDT